LSYAFKSLIKIFLSNNLSSPLGDRGMEFWNNIVNASMIGTDKKIISPGELPADLLDVAELIHANNNLDKEEKFLQLAAVSFNYRQAGAQALHKETVNLPVAPTEEKKYCNAQALQALKDIQSEESIPLLKLWLQQCDTKQQIVQPEILPALLAIGVQEKKLQPLITSCCGKRGEWLGRFNEAWNFSQNQTAEQSWQTGTPEQRKTILKEIRTADPELAREWLLQTWAQEDANTKVAFLEILAVNINETDIAFLETLSTEKSKKVKDAAIDLLKKIPSSAIVQQYAPLLQQSVTLKKEKALLGLSSKIALAFHLPSTIDESIFKTGIDKLSNTKEFTDDEFIIYQLVRSVPPSFWEKQLSASPGNIITHFQKDTTGKKMMPALVLAIRQFNDTNWAFLFMQYSEVFYLELLPLLPLQQQEYYSNKFFDEHPDSIISYAVQREKEWSDELTKHILKHVAKNPYQYNRSFFNQYIHLLPVTIVASLEKCTPPEEHLRTMWSNTSDYIIKLITLKIQILKAFNE
jgi:hypothetical protein